MGERLHAGLVENVILIIMIRLFYGRDRNNLKVKKALKSLGR